MATLHSITYLAVMAQTTNYKTVIYDLVAYHQHVQYAAPVQLLYDAIMVSIILYYMYMYSSDHCIINTS